MFLLPASKQLQLLYYHLPFFLSAMCLQCHLPVRHPIFDWTREKTMAWQIDKVKTTWRSRKTSKGPLVVDAHVLFEVISSEPGLCCCLPSDSPRSVDILLLFVHCKAVHFPSIKSAFTRVCQDVFGAYLQLLSESESTGPVLRSRGGKAALCPKRFYWRRELAQRLSTHMETHINTHADTHQQTVFSLSAARPERTKCLKWTRIYKAHLHTQARTLCSLHRFLGCICLSQRL